MFSHPSNQYREIHKGCLIPSRHHDLVIILLSQTMKNKGFMQHFSVTIHRKEYSRQEYWVSFFHILAPQFSKDVSGRELIVGSEALQN